MKVSEYRQQFDAELAAAATPRRSGTRTAAAARRTETVDEVIAEMTNKRLGVKRRADAVHRAGPRAVRRPRIMSALIALVADPAENDGVRQAALSAVEAGSFKTVEFRRYAAAYKEALRGAVTDDNADLRLQVLDILALNRDSYAQELLVDGLRHPRKARVSPLQAVRMLGYDVHAEHYPLLRDIVETSKRPALRRAALGLLAADSGSTSLMKKIVADKTEDKAARATAAVALQSLAPKEFAKVARTLVLDDDDDDDLRATVISAISHGPTTAGRDVSKKVREIDDAPGGTRQLNRAARQFTAMRARDRRTR